ncbi:putative periplasmic esterase [Actinobacillus pleuropneumoniae]|nr:putative periplasmic esterase [Actinobacillus pleuropneumoniae]
MAGTGSRCWDAVFSAPLAAKPNTEVIYSDLGYLTLGRIIERSLELPLDKRLSDGYRIRWACITQRWTPSPGQAHRYAATEHEESIQDHLCGIVHDEKARALGGVCGHAGLFATAGDLLQYARMWLAQGAIPAVEAAEARAGESRLLSRAAAAAATRPHTSHIQGSSRGLGWVLKGDKMDASGDWMSPHCYGHTGFTGTSLWIDPESDLAVVLLTNRVYGGGAAAWLSCAHRSTTL